MEEYQLSIPFTNDTIVESGLLGGSLILGTTIPSFIILFCCCFLISCYCCFNFRNYHWTEDCFIEPLSEIIPLGVRAFLCHRLNRDFAIFFPSVVLVVWMVLIPILSILEIFFFCLLGYEVISFSSVFNISVVIFITIIASIPLIISMLNLRIYRRMHSCVITPLLSCCFLNLDVQRSRFYHPLYMENLCSIFSVLFVCRMSKFLLFSCYFLGFSIIFFCFPFISYRWIKDIEVLFAQSFLYFLLFLVLLVSVILKCFKSYEREFTNEKLERVVKELLHDNSIISFTPKRMKILINSLYDEKIDEERVFRTLLNLSLLSDDSFGVTLYHPNKNSKSWNLNSEVGENLMNNEEIMRFVVFKLLKEQEIPFRKIIDCRKIQKIIILLKDHKNFKISVLVKLEGEENRVLTIDINDLKEFYTCPFEMAFFRRVVDNGDIPESVLGDINLNIYGIERILRGNRITSGDVEYDDVEINRDVEIRFFKILTKTTKRSVSVIIIDDSTIPADTLWMVENDTKNKFLVFGVRVYNECKKFVVGGGEEDKESLKSKEKEKDIELEIESEEEEEKKKESSSSSSSDKLISSDQEEEEEEEDVKSDDDNDNENDDGSTNNSSSDSSDEDEDEDEEDGGEEIDSDDDNDDADKGKTEEEDEDSEISNKSSNTNKVSSDSDSDDEKKEKKKKKEEEEEKEREILEGRVNYYVRPGFFEVPLDQIAFQFQPLRDRRGYNNNNNTKTKQKRKEIPQFLKLGSSDLAAGSIPEEDENMYLIRIPEDSSKTVKFKKMSSIEKLALQLVHCEPIQMSTEEFLKKRRRYVTYKQKRLEEVAKDRRYMKKLLRIHKFELTNGSVGAGNCQFSSVRDQLIRIGRKKYKRQSKKALGIRREVCDWLEDHRDGMGLLIEAVEGNFDTYLEEMKLEGTYGDDFTLSAMCELYKVNIMRLTTQGMGNAGYVEDLILMTPNIGKAEETIHVAHYVTWEHYESIKKIEDSDSDSSSSD